MDQLRKIVGWFKRQHFWVLSGVVALIALGSWWSAAGTLSKEFTSNKGAHRSTVHNARRTKGPAISSQ